MPGASSASPGGPGTCPRRLRWRNRYQIQAHLPLPDPAGRERTIGEVLALLTGPDQPGAGQPQPS